MGPASLVGRGNCSQRHGLSYRVSAVSVRRSVATKAKTSANPFQKIGTQLAKAGSQFTQTFTGTARVQKKFVVNDKVAFVAGATGRLGARIVKECLLAGYSVRAGVRTVEKGEQLVETAKAYGVLSTEEIARVELVKYDLFDPSSIPAALGNAGCVVCAIGAPEDKPFDTNGPKSIDGEGAIALIEAATESRVKRFVMISSLGTTKLGWPASVLNLFWGVLYWKKQAENALIKSGMAYTIIRPGGMEKPTDSYKDTHNVVLAPRDKFFGGQVSRLQVAELTAAALANPDLSSNKVLEVIAEDFAPRSSYEELLESVPAEISMEEMRERQAQIADVRNRQAGLLAEAEELEATLAEAEEKKLLREEAFSEARAQFESVKKSSLPEIKAMEESAQTIEKLQQQLEAALKQEAATKAVLDAQRSAARSGDILSPADIRSVAQSVLNPAVEAAGEAKQAASSSGRGGLFGGLFGGGAVEKTEEKTEEESKPAAAAPAKEKARVQAKKKEEVVKAPVPEATAKVVRGGGFFGMFQQDTVYADEVEEASAPVAQEKVKPVAAAGGIRKSVKELIPKKSESEKAPPKSAAKSAAKPAAPEASSASAKKREDAVAGALKNLGASAPKKVAPSSEKEATKPPTPTNGTKPAVTATADGPEAARQWIANFRARQKVLVK